MTFKLHASNAVSLIVDDLTDRKGLRHVWDDMDETIQGKIMDAWEAIVLDAINAAINQHRDDIAKGRAPDARGEW